MKAWEVTAQAWGGGGVPNQMSFMGRRKRGRDFLSIPNPGPYSCPKVTSPIPHTALAEWPSPEAASNFPRE